MMTHSFLIIGQSNMAGRGCIADADPLNVNGGKLKVLRNGRWQVMYRPINLDSVDSGSCLAESFAKAYSDDHPDVYVGIIPAADGGTTLDQWQAGGLLFDHAVGITKLALRTSYLKGILWHQGESDCREDRYPLYLEKLTKFANAIRRELHAENVPFLVGGLGDYLSECHIHPWLRNYTHINEALIQFAHQTPKSVFISAQGLTSNPDKLHFDHRSLQEFGLRYYAAFRSVEDTSQTLDETSKADGTKRAEMELL